ncbi:hypothetical protein HK102_006221, partial [Quaeritorhiza haematococci]
MATPPGRVNKTRGNPPAHAVVIEPRPTEARPARLAMPQAWIPPFGVLRALTLGVGLVAASTSANAQAVDFVRDVRPILQQRCDSCHGAKKQKGGLRLDVKSEAFKGGDAYGPAVVPGDAAESPLVQLIEAEDADSRMPASADPLPAAEIATLKTWIEQGAVWPDGVDLAKLEDRLDHWSFKPVEAPAIAPVDPRSWARTPIDRLILARLEQEGLEPSPEADRVAWLRRVSFDLIGLPPTPEQVAAFVDDDRPDAYERVVDALLASPLHGERWAQHWLDLAHYADTNGFELDAERPDAWRYRDWVIAAFNADMPYDRFIALQVAGDEIARGDRDALIATGFCRSGPREVVGGNVIPEVKRQNELTEITATVGSVFLGLTIGCARCHDHKFAPIAQADYYRLQAFFAPVLPVDEAPLYTAEFKAEYDAKLAAWERATADVRAKLAELEKPARAKLERDIVSKFTPDLQVMLFQPDAELSPYDVQIKALAYRQLALEQTKVTEATIAPAERPRWKELR